MFSRKRPENFMDGRKDSWPDKRSGLVNLVGLMDPYTGIARHRGFASLTHSKSQSRIVVTSAAAHGRIVKTVKKVTTYMVGTVKRQNTSSSERSWRKIAETRQSLFGKSAWSGYAHKMCAVDSNTKRLYSNELSGRATNFGGVWFNRW